MKKNVIESIMKGIKNLNKPTLTPLDIIEKVREWLKEANKKHWYDEVSGFGEALEKELLTKLEREVKDEEV